MKEVGENSLRIPEGFLLNYARESSSVMPKSDQNTVEVEARDRGEGRPDENTNGGLNRDSDHGRCGSLEGRGCRNSVPAVPSPGGAKR